jgi:hypothetical protein
MGYYNDDWVDWVLKIFLGGLVACLIVFCVLYVKEVKKCEAGGGRVVGTGEYTTIVTFDANGSPIITSSENQKCVK